MHGKPKDKRILELLEEYSQKISRYQKIEVKYLELKLSKFVGKVNYLEKFLEDIDTLGKQIYILDEDGTEYSTSHFSNNIYEKNLNSGVKEIVFAIGPADGWGDISVKSEYLIDTLKAKNIKIISLSKLAMQHDLAALVLIEQIYRVVAIKNNLPYHRI